MGFGPQMGEHRGEWFGEMHARWSREEEEKGAADGVGVFQGLQCEFKLDVRRTFETHLWVFFVHT
jgi:hypothetical protein